MLTITEIVDNALRLADHPHHVAGRAVWYDQYHHPHTGGVPARLWQFDLAELAGVRAALVDALTGGIPRAAAVQQAGAPMLAMLKSALPAGYEVAGNWPRAVVRKARQTALTL